MQFEELRRFLTDEEIAAIEFLENAGYVVMTETKVEDGKRKGKNDIRTTFFNHGRYDLVIGMQSFSLRAESGDSDRGRSELHGSAAENFWMDFSNWKRRHNNAFLTLLDENLDDLKSAPVDVQEEVKIKFLKKNQINDWPI